MHDHRAYNTTGPLRLRRKLHARAVDFSSVCSVLRSSRVRDYIEDFFFFRCELQDFLWRLLDCFLPILKFSLVCC